jgi:PAS domain S-box-containing protein
MIWEIDPQGKFRYISSQVKTLLGYTPEELAGNPIMVVVPEPARSFATQEIARLVSTDGPLLPFETPARHRDGHDIVLEIRASKVMSPDGKLKGFRGVAHDITKRKRAEEALRMANRQLHLLTGITRHDILNNISVILGFLKITEKKFKDPVLFELLGKMESATKAIRSQIEFTRLYQDLGTHEPQWIDLDAVMPRSHIPSTLTLDADVPGVEVFADPMLEKVFFNLLDNSIRHGERVTNIRLSSYRVGEDLVILWEDNGIGIDEKEKERIFERGFGKNTGLGMFLVREILSLTGITIKETGVPGTGARFEIHVPNGKYRISSRQTSEM